MPHEFSSSHQEMGQFRLYQNSNTVSISSRFFFSGAGFVLCAHNKHGPQQKKKKKNSFILWTDYTNDYLVLIPSLEGSLTGML